MDRLALIVEREPVFRLFLRRALESKGYEVAAFRTRAEASALLNNEEPALAVLDDPTGSSAYRLINFDDQIDDVDVVLCGWSHQRCQRPWVVMQLVAIIQGLPALSTAENAA